MVYARTHYARRTRPHALRVPATEEGVSATIRSHRWRNSSRSGTDYSRELEQRADHGGSLALHTSGYSIQEAGACVVYN